MGNLLETGAVWLESMRTKYLSKSVMYCRGGESVILPATIGRTVFEVERETGAYEPYESRDFLINASDLILSGEPVLPVRGDLIKETAEGKVYEYEVMAPGSEPCWRWSDAYRHTLRIHTKQTGAR
jgi:hypothetical protein